MPNHQVICQQLTEMGFTSLEAEIYLFLITTGSETGYAIAKGLNKATANVYKALDSLSAKGAIEYSVQTYPCPDDTSPRCFRCFPKRVGWNGETVGGDVMLFEVIGVLPDEELISRTHDTKSEIVGGWVGLLGEAWTLLQKPVPKMFVEFSLSHEKITVYVWQWVRLGHGASVQLSAPQPRGSCFREMKIHTQPTMEKYLGPK